MDDIASFRPGVWNGKPFGPEFIRTLHDNFQRYSSGASPYYRPYLSINHKNAVAMGDGFTVKDLRFGVVDGAKVGPGHTLVLSAGEIPEPVGRMRNGGQLTEPSIEFFEPVYDDDGNLVDGFRRPDNSIEPGPVLKCLTFLGSDAPAVKGLPPLPAAKFSHGARVSKFGANAMDRTAMLEALKAFNVDTSIIPDAIPDEVIAAWLASLQAAQAGQSQAPATDATGGQAGSGATTMADATVGAASLVPAPVSAAPTIPGVGNAQPSTVTLKFADAATASVFTNLQNQLRTLGSQVGVMAQQNEANANRDKETRVRRFLDSLATPDRDGKVRITPAQKDTLAPLLMKCDTVKVRKFADGKGTGSELDEMENLMLAKFPPIRQFGEKFHDPVTGNGSGVGVSAETRRLVLSGSSVGRAILAKATTKN
jgi:hypothetical protein